MKGMSGRSGAVAGALFTTTGALGKLPLLVTRISSDADAAVAVAAALLSETVASRDCQRIEEANGRATSV
jgi:hypothetical protein